MTEFDKQFDQNQLNAKSLIGSDELNRISKDEDILGLYC
jgi:hypothetical protein